MQGGQILKGEVSNSQAKKNKIEYKVFILYSV
jgi:hypothetical protein